MADTTTTGTTPVQGETPQAAPAARAAEPTADSAPPVASDAGLAPEAGAATGAPAMVTEDAVKLALRRVKDPEINLNIIDLGLVYTIAIDGSKVTVDMTLTSPGCPSGAELISGAEQELRSVPGVEEGVVNLVWTPTWSPDRIEPRIRTYLGF